MAVLVSTACVVVLTTDVLSVVSRPDVVTVGVCVSITNVEGRPVLVNDLLRVFEGRGYETGPPPEGGTTNVAVMTP